MKVKIVVFLKAPRPGFVKTRLASSLDNVEACRAYTRLAHYFLDTLSPYPDVELRFAPDDAQQEILPFMKSPQWTMKTQGDGDLGQRMSRAMQESLPDADGVLIFGTDCPYIETDDVDTAIEALKSSDVVLGPAADGGYWMIGLRHHEPSLFKDIAWSTNQVLDQSRKRIQSLGLLCRELRELEDVDDIASWQMAEDFWEK